MPATGEYERLALSGELATVRGVELNADDRLRGYVIERLMCEFEFSRTDLVKRFGIQATGMLQVAEDVAAHEELLFRNGDIYEVIAALRPFARQAAAKFDAYLNKGQARHSAAI